MPEHEGQTTLSRNCTWENTEHMSEHVGKQERMSEKQEHMSEHVGKHNMSEQVGKHNMSEQVGKHNMSEQVGKTQNMTCQNKWGKNTKHVRTRGQNMFVGREKGRENRLTWPEHVCGKGKQSEHVGKHLGKQDNDMNEHVG